MKSVGIDQSHQILPGTAIIKRTKIFNPAEFVGAGYTIWRGPANGTGLEGELDQDERSIALNEVDLVMVRFETTLEKDENVVTGEERLVRLKSKSFIRLDPGWLVVLLENTPKIPWHWKKMRYIFFDGQILRRPSGARFALYMGWNGEAWYWGERWLAGGFVAGGPSAVLES